MRIAPHRKMLSRKGANQGEGGYRADPAGPRDRPQYGLLQITKVATVNPEWHGDSWLLTGLAGATTTNLVAAALWTAAIVGFGALAAAVFGWLPMAWWQPLAIASATVSLIGLVLVPVACPFLSTVGAFAVNVALFAAVLWYQWAPRDLAA